MRKPVHRLWCAVLFSLAAAHLFGQTTGSIRGTVRTGGTALPGVTVEARSPNLQGSRTTVTDAEGRFALTLLPPGQYALTVKLEGFGEKKQTLQLGLGQSATSNFELIATKTEEVTVTAQANQVEVESTSIGQNTTSKVFEALPTGRNYASVVQLDAGVGTDASDPRNTSITVYGSTGLENSFLVDGSNTTGVEYGSQGKTLNFEFIQEVEFKAGGYEAEFGHSTGGIVNVVTKSGGNEFHGDGFGYFNDQSLQAKSQHTEQGTPNGIDLGFSKEDYGADIGGFVLKDRLWFFGAYDRVDNSLDRQVTIGPTSGDTANVKTTGNLYSGKLTYHLNDSNTLIGSVFGDPTNDTGAVGQLIGPSTTYDGIVDVGGTDWGLRYEGIFGAKWLVTAQGGVHTENTNQLPGPGGNTIAYQDTTGLVVTAFGGFGGVDGNGQRAQKKFTRDSAVATGSYLLADHDLKAGVDWERVTADVLRNFSGATADQGGQLVQILSPLPGDNRRSTPHLLRVAQLDGRQSLFGSARRAPGAGRLHDFAQDSWKVLRNLTVNAGVRWEKQLIKGASYTTEPDGSIVAGPLTNYININHFSPRVGVSWDFLNDGKTKFFASYGEFVETIPMDMNIRSLNGERDATTSNFDPVSAVPSEELIDADYPTAHKGAAAIVIDPNISTEYLQEVVVGVEHEVASGTLRAPGLYRSLRSTIQDTCVPVDVCDTYAFFNPGNSTVVPCPPDFTLTCYNGQALPGASRFFRGIQVSAQKQLSDHWMLYASYLYSTLRGNFDGSFRAIGGFNARDPNITDDFDYPEFEVGAYGPLTLDRPHQAKLQAAYVFPFNLTFAVSTYYLSGTALSQIGWWDGYGGPELFLSPRGSVGRSPAIYDVDLHLDYGLLLGPITVHILADAFNMLNKQQALTIDQVWANSQSDNLSPTPTNAHYLQPNTYQQARTLRLGFRVSF